MMMMEQFWFSFQPETVFSSIVQLVSHCARTLSSVYYIFKAYREQNQKHTKNIISQ